MRIGIQPSRSSRLRRTGLAALALALGSLVAAAAGALPWAALQVLLPVAAGAVLLIHTVALHLDNRELQAAVAHLEHSSDELAEQINRNYEQALMINEIGQSLEQIRSLNAELEQRVGARTAALEDANRELESLSYSVSHDLRAPLRAIDGFSRILVEEYGPGLDGEARRLLGVVCANAQRMARLIDDLLTFSRLGRADLHAGDVDMAALAAGVCEELCPPAARGRVQLAIGALPPCAGDGALLRQVWVNLIGNALKFSSKCERAKIGIVGEQRGDEIVYHVRDNGVGFDTAYADKLFGVFQRLHGPEQFEGTGVGLAIVQRIVRRHGGRVWADGTPGGGASFGFALPAGRADGRPGRG